MLKNTILVLSGGMDSVTMLYEYQNQIARAIGFRYGSKHNKKELFFANEHCQKLNIPYTEIALDFFASCFNSSLLEAGDPIPHGVYDDNNIRSTVVPFRNGIMLSIAAGIAENDNLPYIMLASHNGDHALYPDCRTDFNHAMNAALQAGTYNHVTLLTPYAKLTKTDIARKGKALNIDYSHTWSCYEGKDIHCGMCATCIERKEALLNAGINDKTLYKHF